MGISKTDIKLLCYLYPAFLFVCFFQTRGVLPPYVPGDGMFMWPFRLFLLYMGIKAFMINFKYNKLLVIFIIYVLSSVIWYALTDFPFRLYVMSLIVYVSPMFMAFVGMERNFIDNKFYDSIVSSWMVCFIIGIYLYIIRPEWYGVALTNQHNSAWFNYEGDRSTEWVLEHMRFSSFMLSSYAISIMGMFMLPICLHRFRNDKKKLWNVTIITVVVVCVLLSMQRAGIISCIFTFLMFMAVYKFSRRSRFAILFLTVSIVALFFWYVGQDETLSALFFDRFSRDSVSDAVEGSRMSQIWNTLSSWNNYLFGEGTGSGGGFARSMGLVGVTDCNYIKMLYEHGIIGVIFFLLIIISTLLKGLRSFRFFFIENSIIISTLITMLVADPLTYTFYILPFWYAIGRVWNPKFKNY